MEVRLLSSSDVMVTAGWPGKKGLGWVEVEVGKGGKLLWEVVVVAVAVAVVELLLGHLQTRSLGG